MTSLRAYWDTAVRFDVTSRSGGIAAAITVVNILYFMGVSFVRQPTDLSNALLLGGLVDIVLGLAACGKRVWSVAVVLFSFAFLLLRTSIDFAT